MYADSNKSHHMVGTPPEFTTLHLFPSSSALRHLLYSYTIISKQTTHPVLNRSIHDSVSVSVWQAIFTSQAHHASCPVSLIPSPRTTPGGVHSHMTLLLRLQNIDHKLIHTVMHIVQLSIAKHGGDQATETIMAD